MAIEPVTREERFLAAAGGRSVTPPTPITRKEQLLQGIIDAVKSGGATPDVIEGAVNDYLNANPVQPGATTEQAAQIEQNKTDIADLQTEVNELKESGGNGSGQNPSQGGGLTTEQINALYGMLRVAAYDPDSDYAGAHAAFCTAFGLDVPDGGDTPGGDTGGDDTGGSGGDNTGGSGGEDSGGNDGDVSNEVKWTDGVAYSYEAVENEYVDTNGTFTAYNGWNRTPYLYCKGAAVLRAVVNAPTSMLGGNNTYNAFYDESKNFISSFGYAGIDNNTAGAYTDIEVPANAVYFAASHKGGVIGSSDSGLSVVNAVGFVPYSEVPV